MSVSCFRAPPKIESSDPSQAVDFIRSAHLSGPMPNEYNFGRYLIWTLPKYRDWFLLREDPSKLLDEYHIAFAILDTSSAPAHAIAGLPGWRRAYTGEVATIFVRQGFDHQTRGINR